ncbi:hypothetical protein LshimejAT787_0801750 [Lyophyllum shimeji]|uniref:YEATS domain-containing protein n=1 Tax=Lyophyllum shimeji TaxID=47721 RepID=A0A9P3PRP3_LYOSH|nr:hypothetical protein LshimejAT787_0801750 [Lyophyllum shimeji]
MTPHKKRKLDFEGSAVECFGETIAELDHEICLRRRLVETIESRITWALLLQEELRRGSSGATTPFKDSALEAISAIETPLGVLFTRDVGGVLGSNYVQPSRPPRPPPKQKVSRNSNANFLYIRSSELEPPYDENHVRTYLLKCPTCLRKTFTSLQGLLNHARISHGLEWNTHDECVRACAVVDPEIDLEMGIEVGLGPNGILPGLRSLFRMAVTAQHSMDPKTEADVESVNGKAEDPPASSHLVRTLGLHEDTPALAPFLGKQAVRRGIKVWGNGDELVDIDGFSDDELQIDGELSRPKTSPRKSRRTWRMHFTHRSNSDPEIASKTQEVGPVASTEPSFSESSNDPSPSVAPVGSEVAQARSTTPIAELGNLVTSGSRFHFAARVIVMDRSFWIPPEQRPASNKGHTHKWMISIDSPSYSYHITTILKRLTVSSISAPGSSSLTTTGPPFVVVGTTGVPFLAKVELCFSGAPGLDGNVTDQVISLEHWVELDLLKSATPVVGDEQVVDIELDKGTVLLPLQKGYTPIGAKILWSQTAESVPAKGKLDDAEATQAFGEILESIAERFPMTLRDAKGGRQKQPQVPYPLVPTSQFKSLIPGRRKAIEWGRVRAIRDAYTQLCREPRFAAQDLVPLTTADVYTWLLEHGHLIRSSDPSGAKREENDQLAKDNNVETWCPTCGQGFEAHVVASAIKTELTYYPSTTFKTETGVTSANGQPRSEASHAFPVPCNTAPRNSIMPMINVYTRMQPCPDPTNRQSDTLRGIRIRNSQGANLVAMSDPNLTWAVRKVIRSLQLPTFASPVRNGQALFPLDEPGTNKSQVEGHLAPYALLATAVQRLIRTLVEGGLDVARRERVALTGQMIKPRRRDGKEQRTPSSVLTPAHILNGVISGARSSSSGSNVLDVAVFECLARLGVLATWKEPSTAGGAQRQPRVSVVSVKEEQL